MTSGSALRAVGRRLAPLAALDKSTGRAQFATDVVLPGMLHAVMLRSSVAYGRIVRIDTSRALAIDGVVAALTFEDVPQIRFGNFAFKRGQGVIEQETKRIQDLFILDNISKFVGDEIAVVAAVDRRTAEAALTSVVVEYEPLVGVFTPEEAMRPDAPELHPGGNLIHPPEGVSALYRPGSGSDPTFDFTRGDPEAGFAEADVLVERVYQTPFVNAASMEPRGCVADWDGQTLSIWDSTQAPFKVRGEIARVLGLEKSQVRVNAAFVGGGFGNKGVVHRYQMLAALLSLRTGRPVRLAYGRKDEFLSGLQRYSGRFTVKIGAARDGRITGIDVKNVVNWGNNARGTVRPVFYGTTSPMLLYRECPNVHYQAYVTYTNLPASGAYRGFGDAECQFAMECAIDEVAEQLHVDPIEFRLKNTIKSGAELLPMFPGQFISSVGLEECLRRGAAHIGWHRRRAPNADGGPLKRGLGCATSMHTGGHLVPATARVQLSSTGEVQVISPLPDIGSGHQTAARQIVAETLNMDAHDARVRWGDTEATDEDFGIHGSRGTFMIGRCLDIAARQVDQQLRDLAAEWLGFAPQELRVQDTQVVAPNGRSLSFGELAAMADRAGQTIQGVGRLEETDAVWGFAAHFAEVEVDTDTGDVKVVRLVAAADVGRAINPLIVEGQLEGAAIQGIGYALSEELVYDPVIRGTLLNPNLLMYELPTIRDVPLVETVIVESDETMHPYGAKGCGETGLVGVAPSIANAIYNATGIRFADLPITPAKILPALESARPPDSP